MGTPAVAAAPAGWVPAMLALIGLLPYFAIAAKADSLSAHPSTAAQYCPNICGLSEPKPFRAARRSGSLGDQSKDGLKAKVDSDALTRIVNGQDANPMGWMVMLRAYDKPELGSSANFETCGGALLNKLWVISAAHCASPPDLVCIGNNLSLVYCLEEVDKDYLIRIMRAYIGLNNINIKEALKPKTIKNFEYQIADVLVPSGWNGVGPRNDISLIKLKTPVTWQISSGMPVLPLCLPSGTGGPAAIQARGHLAMVAGWGYVRNDACFTDNSGPERHTKCRFPFAFRGQVYRECVRMNSPSAFDKQCHLFSKENPKYKEDLGNGAISIFIKYGMKKRTMCYAEESHRGWCGVCDKRAKEGQHGYCDFFGGTNKEEEITIVKGSKNWGFCSKMCELEEQLAQSLQETRISLLDKADCKVFYPDDSSFDNDMEFCGGVKISFPKTHIFLHKNSTKPKSKAQPGFKYLRTVLNPLGVSAATRKLKYYVGSSDSCQGDSGGPVFQIIEKRAHLVGIVSRGGECAELNVPGIYTDITHYLDWINSNISNDDDCSV